jgi:phosphocarrier protein HPr
MSNHRTVLVTNPQGLHLRACAEIVKTVERYRARVTVRKGEQAENAASVLGLLSLAAECGTKLALFATGPEAEEALQAICELFGDGNERSSRQPRPRSAGLYRSQPQAG